MGELRHSLLLTQPPPHPLCLPAILTFPGMQGVWAKLGVSILTARKALRDRVTQVILIRMLLRTSLRMPEIWVLNVH